MRTSLRRIVQRVSQARRAWLTLLLLLAVLAPSACLLWFMTQAVRNERLAVRQKLMDAYRGHLALAQDRLTGQWRLLAESLDTQVQSHPASAVFAQLVRTGQADSAVIFSDTGDPIYPGLPLPIQRWNPSDAWAEAQSLERLDPAAAAEAYGRLAEEAVSLDVVACALQAQARCLIRSGDRAAALTVLTHSFGDQRLQATTDPEGRLVSPNAWLLALELIGDSTSAAASGPRRQLVRRLEDYEDPALSASQRRFLMRELLTLSPGTPLSPGLDAEELAARYVDAVRVADGETGLRSTPLPGIWQFVAAQGRVVTLHREDQLRARMQQALLVPGLPQDVVLEWIAPGQEEKAGTLFSSMVGPLFPGWRLALALSDEQFFESASRARITGYRWTGVLVVVAVLALGMVAVSMMRREAALTQLRNDLVANVTHELKTPLSSMRLLVETLLSAPRIEEPTARDYLQLIATENLRLSRLIDNFLTFSRIERNKYGCDFREVPAESLAKQAVTAVSERFQSSDCRFEVRIAPDLPSVRADADAMVTALMNLLDNAWKYGGSDKHIVFTAGSENGAVVFRVQDNGPGISPRDRKRIFKRFYRANAQGSRPSTGCGLGLSIVQLVVTAHGGTVSLQCEPGRGSTFTVSLPTQPESAAAP